ncbi:phytochrome and flowering time regulatory protein [Striga asiatica]|uniref:Phytochrome and flowering time regulatory protein n=1 Tax=Striga asiatica TaxID=4170 RepID=A0A5A7PA59_STRAF|nr:phytochrome and flowering time regulatory protein [Striga asiatica]
MEHDKTMKNQIKKALATCPNKIPLLESPNQESRPNTRPVLLLALSWPEITFRQKKTRELLEPPGPFRRPQHLRVVPYNRARVGPVSRGPHAPPAGNNHPFPFKKKLRVDPVEHRVVSVEFPGERGVRVDHPLHVVEREVAVNCRVSKLGSVADDRVEIAFGGR